MKLFQLFITMTDMILYIKIICNQFSSLHSSLKMYILVFSIPISRINQDLFFIFLKTFILDICYHNASNQDVPDHRS